MKSQIQRENNNVNFLCKKNSKTIRFQEKENHMDMCELCRHHSEPRA